MNRVQTHYRRCWGFEAAKWFPLLLLALAICWLPEFGPSVAQAEDAATEQETQTEATASAAEEPAAKASDESDTAADGDKEKEAGEQPAKEKPSDEQPSDGEQSQDKESKQDGDSTASEDSKEMKKSENSTQEPKSAGEDKANVETERPVDVEPPKEAAEKPDEKTDPKKESKEKCIIGATATLLEKQSELKFRARVDSGAKSCSLHVEEVRIEGESKKEDVVERMTENIGKVIHFKIKNGDDKTHILTSKIAGYVIIKNSNKKEGTRRYKVPLTFRWKHMEKEVLVTLTDRNHMEYPLLLGRNFLRGDFLVDVELDSDD